MHEEGPSSFVWGKPEIPESVTGVKLQHQQGQVTNGLKDLP